MTTRVFALALSLALPLGMTSLRAEDWATKDGKTYQEVAVVKVEPDAVTILHHDGGARIPLKNLPPEIQKRCNYDPAAAAAAEAARAQADEENRQALQAEMDTVAARKLAMQIALHPNPPLPPLPGCTTETPVASTSSDSTHHGMGELVDTKKRLRDDHDDDTDHYSMGALKRSAHSLLSGSDNSNHYSQGDLFHSGSNLQ